MSGSTPDRRPERAETARDTTSDAVTITRDTDLIAPSTPGAETQVVDVPPTQVDTSARYVRDRLLGKGGMGEVLLCRDQWIGRDVAMKVMRARVGAHVHARARFLREAAVQGQLEHPNVVPVYDIGTHGAQEDYFTMKRVKGLTLEQIIDGLRKRSREIAAAFGQRKLLAAMSQVCLALAYAHNRGVVHRDLKPSNIMLGGFGEVYVLDWGVAKLQSATTLEFAEIQTGEQAEAATEAGAVVGTPTYMSPEQAFAEREISAAADGYSLGAILFELVSLERFRTASTLDAVGASVLAGPVAPSERAPNRD